MQRLYKFKFLFFVQEEETNKKNGYIYTNMFLLNVLNGFYKKQKFS